jgi:hypothetical protein
MQFGQLKRRKFIALLGGAAAAAKRTSPPTILALELWRELFLRSSSDRGEW